MMGRQARRRLGAAVAAAVAGVGVAAVAVPGGHAAAPVASSVARATEPAGADAFKIAAHDGTERMWFHISGKAHQGRIAMQLVNRGTYAHEATLLHLKKGVTLAQFKKALHQKDPEKAANKLLIDPNGEITGPALLGPGMRETVYAPLKAGHYVVLCFLPGPDGTPHALMGMVAEVDVQGPPVAAAAPATEGTITLTDSRIELPRGFTGSGTYRVVNTGKRAHDLSFARLKGKATLMRMFTCVGQSFARNTMIDRCPGTLAGGVTDLAPGHAAYLRLHLPTGHYGYLSTDGKDVQHGMRGTFRIR